ncbi:MAG: helix-turn-helix domain-containing protein [Cyanobacteria bacterium J06631_2]
MPRLAPKPVELEDEEKRELEKILARHSTSQQVAKRAKIILLASLGRNHRDIARELNISRKMARLWRERWCSAFAQIVVFDDWEASLPR